MVALWYFEDSKRTIFDATCELSLPWNCY